MAIDEQALTSSPARAPEPFPAGARHRPPRKWRYLFIQTLRKTGNVSLSCREAGISRTTVYMHRDGTSVADRKLRADWDDAMYEASDYLEQEALRRAVTGWDEPVFGHRKLTNADGSIVEEKGVVGYVRKYSDRMLEMLLRGAKPDKYATGRMEHSGPGGGPIPIEDVAKNEIAARLVQMAERLEARGAAALPSAPGPIVDVEATKDGEKE